MSKVRVTVASNKNRKQSAVAVLPSSADLKLLTGVAKNKLRLKAAALKAAAFYRHNGAQLFAGEPLANGEVVVVCCGESFIGADCPAPTQQPPSIAPPATAEEDDDECPALVAPPSVVVPAPVAKAESASTVRFGGGRSSGAAGEEEEQEAPELDQNGLCCRP